MSIDKFDIQPWDEENTHIPQKFFLKRFKTASSQRIKKPLLGLSKTEEAVIRKLKTEQNGIIFKTHEQEEKMFTLNFDCNREWTSNLRRIVMASKKQEVHIIGRKKSKKGVQIDSIKKKIVDFDQKLDHSLVNSRKKIEDKQLTLSFYQNRKQKQDEKRTLSNILQVRKAHFAKKSVISQGLFMGFIASISKERKKIVKPQINQLNRQSKIERGLFLQNNKKFRSWHNLSKHNLSVKQLNSL